MEKKGLTILVVVGIVVALAIVGGVTYTMGVFDFLFEDDNDGAKNNTIDNDPNSNPVAVITIENADPPYSFNIGEVIDFNASASQGNITHYTWDFGDGITADGGATVASINHSYSSRGFYSVNLSVMSVKGAIGKTNVTIEIQGEPFTDSDTSYLSNRIGSSNTTIDFNIDSDARNLTLDFLATGLSQEGSAKLNIAVFDPFHQLLGNRTLTVTLQGSDSMSFSSSEIRHSGTYFVELNCEVGTLRVITDIYVGY